MPAAARGRAELFDEAFLKKLEYLHIVSRKVFAGRLRADRRTRKAGAGVEFADHRDYVPGDDLRYLDWSIFGRLDKLLLRLFEEEEDLHVYLLVDASASMLLGRPPKLEQATKIAAALAYVALANLDRVSVQAFSDGLRPGMAPARGKGRVFKVFEQLRAIEPGGVTDLRASLEAFVLRQRRRGVAVVISDFYDPDGYEEGLNLLRYHRFEPFVVQVIDPAEARPGLRGDLRLVDCETGEAREVTVSPRTLEAYVREHARFCAELKAHCTARAVPFFQVSTEAPFEELVLRVFRAGGFLR